VSLSGGLFRNSISKKAKSYYSKFEKNGNVQVAGSAGHGILQNIMKAKQAQLVNRNSSETASVSAGHAIL